MTTLDYFTGLPDLSDPLSRYTLLIRAPWDPQRSSREERRERLGGHHEAATEWRQWRKAKPEEWLERILDLMKDGEPRTFNAMAVELVDAGADAVGDTAEAGLWLAVEKGLLWWSSEAPIQFLHHEFVTKSEEK